MELEKALEGLLLSKGADSTSPHTIKVYQYVLMKCVKFSEGLFQSEKIIRRFFIGYGLKVLINSESRL